MKTMFAVLLVATSMGGCAAKHGGAAPPESGVKPGDHFFRTVVASRSAKNGATANIALFDPALASRRPAGSPGTTAGSHDAAGAYYPSDGSGPVHMTGTYDPTAGTFRVSGHGVLFDGTVAGSSVTGSATTPDGDESFGGEDLMASKVSSFCGSYSGDASGQWNFVISGTGDVAGAFSGSASGSIHGSASGSSITIQWSGSLASGSASGTVNASSNVQGSWNGATSDGSSVMGTWKSDGACGGLEPVVSADTSPGCVCDPKRQCPAPGPVCVE